MPSKANMIGAVSANLYMLLIIAVFAARIAEWDEVALWCGILSSFVLVPLIYLFFMALKKKQPVIYFIWLFLMILFALFELIADIILIAYVMFFFGSTGGMIGIASRAGKRWTIATIIVFLIMAVMAFVQRGITGI
jgi:hypothetical protein